MPVGRRPAPPSHPDPALPLPRPLACLVRCREEASQDTISDYPPPPPPHTTGSGGGKVEGEKIVPGGGAEASPAGLV